MCVYYISFFRKWSARILLGPDERGKTDGSGSWVGWAWGIDSKERNRSSCMQQAKHTVVSHIKGGEAGIHMTQHGIHSLVTFNLPPPTTGLPHTVHHATNLQSITSILHNSLMLLTILNSCRLSASNFCCSFTPHHRYSCASLADTLNSTSCYG